MQANLLYPDFFTKGDSFSLEPTSQTMSSSKAVPFLEERRFSLTEFQLFQWCIGFFSFTALDESFSCFDVHMRKCKMSASVTSSRPVSSSLGSRKGHRSPAQVTFVKQFKVIKGNSTFLILDIKACGWTDAVTSERVDRRIPWRQNAPGTTQRG